MRQSQKQFLPAEGMILFSVKSKLIARLDNEAKIKVLANSAATVKRQW